MIWLLLSAAIGGWASSRGHGWFAGFLISAILSPVVGAIIIAATPDRRAEARHAELVGAISRDKTAPDTRPCPRCAEDIKRAAKMCRFCQAEVEPLAVEPLPTEPLPSASTSQPSKGVEAAVGFALIFLLLVVALVGGVSQLGSSANATFTTVSGSQ